MPKGEWSGKQQVRLREERAVRELRKGLGKEGGTAEQNAVAGH